MKMARRAGSRSVPDEPYRVEEMWSQYANVRGADRLGQIVSGDFSEGLISVFLRNANFVDTRAFMDRVEGYVRTHLKPLGIRVDFAGDVAISQSLIAAIVSTEIRSLLLSVLGVLVVSTLLNRSLLVGVLSVLPCALAVATVFSVMGILGVPLGVATSMFAGMTLGIGVDYAIHFLERVRASQASASDGRSAIVTAFRTVGPAIVIDALAVGLGFSVMLVSQVPANARLGGMLVVSVAASLAATLLLLPALVYFFPLGRAAGERSGVGSAGQS
jgi:uncharacterized protein